MRGARWLLLAPLAIQPACPSSECVQLLDPNIPSPAIECAAGTLCYQGSCIDACAAGQEGAQQCGSDDDCDNTRPNCNDGFCSACDDGEVCIPTLNICRELDVVDEVAPPPPPPSAPPPGALDGGWIDGGIKVGEDGGVVMPVELPVTYVGLIDVAQLDASAAIAVQILYVGEVDEPGLSWSIDPPFPPATETVVEVEGGCTLLELQTFTGSVALTPANLGDIQIRDSMRYPGSLTATISIPWNGTDYAVPQNLPPELLRFSRPGAPRFIDIVGAGSPLTNLDWPRPLPANGEHVPFELKPSPDTETLLTNGALVELGPDGAVMNDLLFTWSTTAFVNGESVVVRFRSADHAVRCLTAEAIGEAETTIIVPREILRSFAQRANAAETTFELSFERSFTRRTDIGAVGDDVINVAIRIRHTRAGTIRFDQR